MSDGLDMAGSARSGTGGRRDAMGISERKPEACPQCGDPGFVNPTTGRWQCGNAGCDNTDEIEFVESPLTPGAVSLARSECAICEACGHAQAEPNWCQKCGHRTTWPEWAKRWEASIRQQLEGAVSVTDEMVQVAREEIVRVGARQMSPNAMRRVLRAALEVPDGQ